MSAMDCVGNAAPDKEPLASVGGVDDARRRDAVGDGQQPLEKWDGVQRVRRDRKEGGALDGHVFDRQPQAHAIDDRAGREIHGNHLADARAHIRKPASGCDRTGVAAEIDRGDLVDDRGRRRIGELFAGSTGFAVEFGLTLETPGRLSVRGETRLAHGHFELPPTPRYMLIFANTGETEIVDASWSYSDTNGGGPSVEDDPFPITHLAPGAEIPVELSTWMDNPGHPVVLTHWTDTGGQKHEQEWTVGW